MTASFHMGAIEEKIFHFPIARAEVSTLDEASKALRYAEKHAAKLLVIRCPTDETAAIHYLESQGAQLMDTLVRMTGNCSRCLKRSGKSHIPTFSLEKGDEKAIGQIARTSFHSFPSHFHCDPRLDGKRCDDFYERWTFHLAAERGPKNEIFVTKHHDILTGFGVTRLIRERVVEGTLAGTSPIGHSKGFYTLRALLIRSLEHAASIGATRFEISAVLNNIGMHRLCSRLGFEYFYSMYTFHRWLD